jgi:hypothetical protein
MVGMMEWWIDGVLECWIGEVLEWWIDGMWVVPSIHYSKNPITHRSIDPTIHS